MARDNGTFDKDSARRIADVVRRIERTPFGRKSRRRDGGDDPFQFRRFTLKDALSPTEGNGGTTATAHLVTWDGANSKFEVNTDVEFEVRDPSGCRYGQAYNENEWHWFVGLCIKPFDMPEWEILSLPQWVLCRALTKGAVADSDATYTVDNVKVMHGAWPVDDAADELTVQNTFDDEIDDNAVVTIAWNAEQGQWETADVTCPA